MKPLWLTLTPSMLAAIDQARGEKSRDEWIQEAMKNRLERESAPRAPRGRAEQQQPARLPSEATMKATQEGAWDALISRPDGLDVWERFQLPTDDPKKAHELLLRKVADRPPGHALIEFVKAGEPKVQAKRAGWPHALKGRREFLSVSFKLGERPHSQENPTADVIELEGTVGINFYSVKVDRLWATEHKDKAKKEALEALEAFSAQVRKAIENA